MQITSTVKPHALKATQKAQSKPAQEQQESQDVFRPLTEQWTVGENTYSSTQELLKQAGNLDNVKATYSFTTEEAPEPFTSSEKVMNAVGSGLQGAAAGAVVGGIIGTGLAVMGAFADILSMAMYGPGNSNPKALLAIPVALGAVIGGGVGGTQGFKAIPEAPNGKVEGVLKLGQDGAAFFPAGQVEKKVDLNTFKDAAIPHIGAEVAPESSPFKNAAKGAAVGLAAIPAQFIPLGLFGPPAVGGMIGDALDKRTQLGAGVGLAAGVATTGAAIAALDTAINGDNIVPLVALAGGLAVGGALLGDKVITEMNTVSAHRDYGNQWWNEKKDEE